MTPSDFDNLLISTIHPAEVDVLAAGCLEYAQRLVYLMKHIEGIAAYVRGHRSQWEDIRGRIKDARAYLTLLWGMVEEGETDAYNTDEVMPNGVGLHRVQDTVTGFSTRPVRWVHFCGARAGDLVALPVNREHCDACGMRQSENPRTVIVESYKATRQHDKLKSTLTIPWKHTCSSLRTVGTAKVPEIMVYTAVCPYCQTPTTETSPKR